MTNDLRLFLLFLVVGAVVGVLWGLSNHIVYWVKHRTTKKVLRFVFDVSIPIFTTIVVIAIANIHNFGQIRWFFILSLLLGMVFERKTIGKMFAKLNIKLYNSASKTKTKFLSTKLGSKLTK